MSLIAGWLGISRQAVYKSQQQFDRYQDLCEQVVGFVHAHRLINKKIGGCKLSQCFSLEHPNVIGRDRFLTILRERGLLLGKKRPQKRSAGYIGDRQNRQDLAYHLSVAGPGHLWVHDDTEVVTSEGKAHLALSTDAYSHKVIGYSWSRRADTEHVKQALLMSLEDFVPGPHTLIHHSDNASVYASKAYQMLLKKQQILPSWTPPGRPDRNPIAERINLTFKQEYLCDSAKKTFAQIKQELPVYIRHYNESRPHMSCGNGFPSQVHEQEIKPKQLWKQRPVSYRRTTPAGVPPLE